MKTNRMVKAGVTFFMMIFLAAGVAFSAGKIDINTASAAQLQDLDGIGPVIAKRIVDYRNNVQLFKTPEDLKNVKGIGVKTFQKNADRIIVTFPKAASDSDKKQSSSSKKGN